MKKFFYIFLCSILFVLICCSIAAVYYVHSKDVARLEKEVFRVEKNNRKDLLKALNNARHIVRNAGTPLTLLHFSDIHNDKKALSRIMADAVFLGNSVDDMICTGDVVGNTSVEDVDWWNPKVMITIGNHDTALKTEDGKYNWTALSMAERTAKYIEPFESEWDVIHTPGTSYYYKDYTKQNVRLIVMDMMLYTGKTTATEAAAQTSWLEGLLSSASESGLHVLIAAHAPRAGAVPIPSSFTKIGAGKRPLYPECNTPDTVINTVASAITSGLHFIGYLVGHTHQDTIYDATGDRTQLMFCITCANTYYEPQWINTDLYRGDDESDAYNLVTINTANSVISIIRGGGADIDNVLRSRTGISINYSTGKLISE